MLKRAILFPLVLIFVFAGVVSSVAWAEEDVEGSKDHPMISRYEGSVIKGYEHVDYDRIEFPSGVEDDELQTTTVEGEVTKIIYAAPEGLSVLQVQRNYLMALKEAGFEIAYECFGGLDEIPRDIYRVYSPGRLDIPHKSPYIGKDHSYFLAKKPEDDGDIYVSAHTLLSERFDDRPATALQILEEKPMDTGKVQVDIDAEAMAEDIEEKGSVRSEEDVEGSRDHPMISRYEGSVIKGYEHVDYDRIEFPSGVEDDELQTATMEGEVTKIIYAAPEELSVLQVQRNYLMALKEAGFEIAYECFGGLDEIPRDIYRVYSPGRLDIPHKSPYIGKDHSYFLAKNPEDDGDIYVSAHTLLSERFDDRLVTALQILEEKPMDTGKVQVDIDAEAMAEDIKKKGGIRIYGIHFDTGKATIKKKSEPALAEIAAFLAQKPDLRLFVVGHTDAVGDKEYNMDLSEKRAEAVVAFLASEHGISKDRLIPHGVGPLAPVASNEDEDGRAQNRRVELVKITDQ